MDLCQLTPALECVCLFMPCMCSWLLAQVTECHFYVIVRRWICLLTLLQWQSSPTMSRDQALFLSVNWAVTEHERQLLWITARASIWKNDIEKQQVMCSKYYKLCCHKSLNCTSIWHVHYVQFITSTMLASAGISCRRVSVCLSACLSICHKSMFYWNG